MPDCFHDFDAANNCKWCGYAKPDGDESDAIAEDMRNAHEFWSKVRIEFEGGGMRDNENGKPRFDLLMPERVPYEQQYLTRVARLMARGAEHYEDRNWENMSSPEALARFRSSAMRHFMQWMNGETDEDHAAAVFFNVQGAEYVKGRLNGDFE